MTLVDINGRFLTQAITGVQRAALELVRSLDRELAADQALRDRYSFRLLTPPHPARDIGFQNIPSKAVGVLRGQLWEQLELPFYARGRLLLSLCNTAPVGLPTLVMIHDASVFAFPAAYSTAFRTWYRTLIPLLGSRAHRITTSSQFSRIELATRAGVPLEKIDVVPLGGEHILQTPADTGVFRRVPVEPGRYLLTVGSRSPHKNLARLVTAVSRLGADALPLVLAGGVNPRVFRQAAVAVEGGYHEAGYVTDAELRALYEHAGCFVFPSLYEGFGIPPLEAMVCGCPAVVANTASLPEVCGDAVLYFDPRDPDDIARVIRLALEPGRREELRHRGRDRAARFTWARASRALVGTIDRIASS
jgi:glycosyltransferase involved in cell wall biosynthesis